MPLSPARSYHFADFVRFVAMCAIIFQHSFIVQREILMADHSAMVVFFFLKVIAKIGSISFFIVSGFLLSAALERYTAGEYYSKRVKNILKPYLLFVAVYFVLDIMGAFFGQEKISNVAALPGFIGERIVRILFFTNYWFIFNYFISVTILLLLRKYLYNAWLGIVLFSCTMIYALNAHFEFFVAQHTAAFLGFTFFLWLGANIGKEDERFWRFIDSTDTWKLILIVLFMLGLDFMETYYLIERNAQVVDSSLKVTNILYAISVFLLLCKIGKHARFKFINPRDETYPLYLIHPIFLKVINYAMLPLLPAVSNIVTLDDPAEVSWLTILLYQIGWFVAIYLMSLCAVKLILSSPFRWVFGKTDKVTATPKAVVRPIE